MTAWFGSLHPATQALLAGHSHGWSPRWGGDRVVHVGVLRNRKTDSGVNRSKNQDLATMAAMVGFVLMMILDLAFG